MHQINKPINRVFFGILLLALLAKPAPVSAEVSAEPAKLERSYWVHASLGLTTQKGYWGPDFPSVEPPTRQEVENAARLLTGPYKASRLYLIYHKEMPISDARRVFAWWREACPNSVELVPTFLLRMYDKKQTPVFTAEEVRELADFCRAEINAERVAVYDVYSKREQGEALALLAKSFTNGLIRVGVQPSETIAPPFVAGVQDTWSGFCHGTLNQEDWLQPGFGAETLRKWVEARNLEAKPTVWNLIVVAWDYKATARGGYPGYDDAEKNMPLPAGRNLLGAALITKTASHNTFAGFSSDLYILQENSRSAVHDGKSNSFYQTLREGKAYQGYYAAPFQEITKIYRELVKGVFYEPTRESLSRHAVPEWYQDAKIGFFYHWGPQSVVGEKFDKDALLFCRAQGKYAGMHAKNPPGQWGASMYPKPGKPEKQQNGAYLLHTKWYGDPKTFGYKDLIPLMTGEKFDPEGMVKLLDEAGVKYIAPMAVHHDGFAMWDSKVIDTFNAAKMGPKKDTTKLVIDAARKRAMKVGVSTHVMRHSWYYPKLDGYDTSDPRYVQLYGEGIEKGGLPKPAALVKWENTLKELIDTFQPDYIFSDGDTADVFCNTGSYVCTEAFRRIVAYYYNAAQSWGGEPVITFKRESLYKEEAVPDYEGGKLFGIAPYKWQTHSSICGWFYRNGESVTPSKNLFRDILDVVSKNGNMLISLGLKGDGSMQACEVAFLKEMAIWTRAVGEGIFATRPWRGYGELEPGEKAEEFALDKKGIVFDDPATIRKGRLKLHEGDLRFTRSKDGKSIYVARLSCPKKPFTVSSFSATGIGKDVKISSLSLLGSDEKIGWTRDVNGIMITPPAKALFEDPSWPVIFKLVTE
jgi:alpha-L-fucosidase